MLFILCLPAHQLLILTATAICFITSSSILHFIISLTLTLSFSFLFISSSLSLLPHFNKDTMVGTSLEQQLRNFLRSMHDQGILDHNFENVRRLQTQGNPQFLTEVVTMFINDADVSMAETTRLMNEPELDYETLTSYFHQLRGSSASIGGCRMAVACRDVRQAIDARDKARCLETFERVKQEYQTLRNSFNNILQLERSIIAYENRRRHT